MKIKLSEAVDLIVTALKAKLVTMIHGSPAIGKSAIVKQIAQQFGLKVIDLRLSQCDPTDLMGFPSIKGDKAAYTPMDTFPVEGDKVPEGYEGWLLFLDEFNSAPLAVQAAAYKVVLDRMVGQHHLHKNVAIICAGNLETDGAITQTMSTALQSRMVHLEVEADAKDWLAWANEHKFDYRITSYLEFRPDNLYTFSPEHSDKTYASPRTWEFANQSLAVIGDTVSKAYLPLLAGTLGEGVARDFYGFCGIHEKLPKMATIEASPQTVPVPEEASIQYALTGALAAHANEHNCEALMDFVQRMPAEMQVVTARSMVRRNKSLLKLTPVTQWIGKFASEVL